MKYWLYLILFVIMLVACAATVYAIGILHLSTINIFIFIVPLVLILVGTIIYMFWFTKGLFTGDGKSHIVTLEAAQLCSYIDDDISKIMEIVNNLYTHNKDEELIKVFSDNIEKILPILKKIYENARLESKRDLQDIGYKKINETMYTDIMPKITEKAISLIKSSENKEFTYEKIVDSLIKIHDVIKSNARTQLDGFVVDTLWKKHITDILGAEFVGIKNKDNNTTCVRLDTDL